MKYKSYSVYDDDDFFDKYIQKRNRNNSPNEVLERPIIEKLIGSVKGKEVLDLGCGDGVFGKILLKNGLKTYHGVDGSINMIKLAIKNLEGTKHKLENKDIEKYQFPAQKYDLVLSRLVFHYIEDLEKVFKGIYKSLRKDGYLIFSVEHPIITSCYDSYHQKVKRQNWIVDDYFQPDERVNKWMGKEVIKYHKTIEEYFRLFKLAGLQIEEFRESKPELSNFENMEEYKRRSRIPLFMLFKLKKKESQ